MASSRPGLVSRALEFRRSPAFTKLWRYGTVSVVSTVLSLGLLYLFFRVAKLTAIQANVVATVVATVPSYYLNRNWAWGKTGKSHLAREVIPFWVIAFAGLVLSTLAVGAADHAARHAGLGHHFETAVVLAANFFTYGVIWVGKFVLFNKVLFVERAEGLDDLGAPAEPAEPSDVATAAPAGAAGRPTLRVLRGSGGQERGSVPGAAPGAATVAAATPRAKQP